MDLFVKHFKREIPYTYPCEGDFLPKLGLCGTLNNGIFNSNDVLITDKTGIESITIETEKWTPAVKEFSNIKNIQLLSNFETEVKFMAESTEMKGTVFFKPFNFESEGDFYYSAIHLRRDYIYNPEAQLKNFIVIALKEGKWRINEVVITSILYGKNPLILKATKNGTVSIIGGEISADLSGSDITIKTGFMYNDNSFSVRRILDPNDEVAVGFQMMRLRRFKKQLEKLRGENTDNSYDIFEDIYNDYPEYEYTMEYV
jgi:hypothetical protein